jgi:hypothetical protein
MHPLGEAAAPSAARHTPPVKFHLGDRLDISIRTVTLEDEPLLLEFLTGLCEDSRRLRFFTAAVNLRAEAHRGAAGDDTNHCGVLAITPERGVVGHAIYVRVPGSASAEVAVVVGDGLHRLGVATALLIRLAQVAESRQITCFFAEVLPENHDMLTLFQDGFAATTVGHPAEMDVLFSTSSWRGAAQPARSLAS